MEGYCNQNASERRNYHNLSERSMYNARNCATNNRMQGCNPQMGKCNSSMMEREGNTHSCKREQRAECYRSQERMLQNDNVCCKERRTETECCREEGRMHRHKDECCTERQCETECCTEEGRMHRHKDECCAERQCETNGRDESRNIEVECVCRVVSEHECHRHDEMEKLGCRFPVVMSYVPWQQWGELYDPDCALKQGTIFKDLNYIFCGERCL